MEHLNETSNEEVFLDIADPETLRAANINPISGLATDYLNHFNEVIMLVEIVSDIPDIIEDIKLWEPLSYIDHFDRSGFKEKDLIIASYLAAPSEVRDEFDLIVEESNNLLIDYCKNISNYQENSSISEKSTLLCDTIKENIAKASGIINATNIEDIHSNTAQDNIDELLK